MSRLNFQPVANPTSQFAQTEVRAKATGSGLIDIANALADLTPKARDLSLAIHQDHVKQMYSEAQASVTRYQIQNQQQFKKLVDEGKIPLHANPWFQKASRSIIASLEVEKASRDLTAAYVTEGYTQRETPEVEQFVDDFFSKNLTLGDRDPDELNAMTAKIAEAKDRLIRGHINNRSEETLRTFGTAASAELGRTLMKHDALAVMAGDSVASMALRDSLTKFIDDKSRYLPHSVLNDIISNAAADYAEVSGDPSLFKEVLSSVKTPGGTLFDIPAMQAKQAQLDADFVRRQQTQYESSRKERDFAETQAGMMVVMEAHKRGLMFPVARLHDMGLSPEAFDKVLSFHTKLNAAAAGDEKALQSLMKNKVISAAIPDLMKWVKNHPGELPVEMMLTLAGQLGEAGLTAEDIFSSLSAINTLVNNTTPKEDPKLYAQLATNVYVGGSTDVRPILTAASQIGMANVGYLLRGVQDNIEKRGGSPTQAKDYLNAAAEQLEGRAVAAVLLKAGVQAEDDLLDSADLQRIKDLKNTIKAEAAQAYYRQLQTLPKNAPQDQVFKMIDTIIEQTAKKYGAIPAAKYDEFRTTKPDPAPTSSATSQTEKPKETLKDTVQKNWTSIFMAAAGVGGLRTALNNAGPVVGAIKNAYTEKPVTPDDSASPANSAASRQEVVKILEPEQIQKLGKLVSLKSVGGEVNPSIDYSTYANHSSNHALWSLTGGEDAMADKNFRDTVFQSQPGQQSRLQLLAKIGSPKWKQEFEEALAAAEKDSSALVDANHKPRLRFETKKKLVELYDDLANYEIYTRSYGYSIPEVIAAGPNAWQKLSAFASVGDATDEKVLEFARQVNADPMQVARYQRRLANEVERQRTRLFSPLTDNTAPR